MPATNRDLYLAVRALIEAHRGSARTLEEYLSALWWLGRELRERPILQVETLVRLLEDAFTATPPEDPLASEPRLQPETGEGFARWEQLIVSQIRDLREMAAAGTLENEMRWFGVEAPGGSPWYNFDPAGFIEAGVEGTFGGWEPEDGGRVLVNGPVATVAPDGTITTMDAADIERPIYPLEHLDWDAFARFLQNGQWYE
ncbi:MAG TPA: hypothetical protein VHG08_08895 [Longimicrobium sp.]|nr:hypothetical protein [Longimicrobium sp.]